MAEKYFNTGRELLKTLTRTVAVECYASSLLEGL